NAYIRPLVVAGNGMNLKINSRSDIVIIAWNWDFFNGNKLIDVCISPYPRIHPAASPAMKVSGNYLNAIMATTDANNKGFDDAIQLDSRGFIAETPNANLFIEKDGKIYTPQASEYILA